MWKRKVDEEEEEKEKEEQVKEMTENDIELKEIT